MADRKFEKQLYSVLASLRDEAQAKKFIRDLCTPQEIEHMAERLEAARLLMENKTYQDVLSRVNISSATLSRVSKCVKYSDGYKEVLNSEAKK